MTNQPNPPPRPPLDRQLLEAEYRLFERYAFGDQHSYYERSVARNRVAGRQVNRIRAFFALLTGVSSALAALIIASQFGGSGVCGSSAPPDSCGFWGIVLVILPLLSVIFPALGGAFSTLADLYQWERLTSIYSSALENLEVVNAHSPQRLMNDEFYNDLLRTYALDTLSVMRDEASQWGQLVKTPAALEDFLAAVERQNHAPANPGNPAPPAPPATDSEPLVPPPSPPPPDTGIDPLNPGG